MTIEYTIRCTLSNTASIHAGIQPIERNSQICAQSMHRKMAHPAHKSKNTLDIEDGECHDFDDVQLKARSCINDGHQAPDATVGDSRGLSVDEQTGRQEAGMAAVHQAGGRQAGGSSCVVLITKRCADRDATHLTRLLLDFTRRETLDPTPEHEGSRGCQCSVHTLP